MSVSAIKRPLWIITLVVIVQLAIFMPVKADTEGPTQVKELNFVFLHGAAGTCCAMQLLADTVMEQIEPYIQAYEEANPDIDIQVNILNRCYPSDVDMQTWANNIADSVGRYLRGKQNIILIGHSAGGKAALYAVAHNIGGMMEKVAMVVTINSPIDALENYYITGGAAVVDYCSARWLLADAGVCDDVAYYDSTEDGSWVASNKHWLAFVSGESAPSSEQFDYAGVDVWPRDMDDSTVPIAAQYSTAADVVYYGEYGHSDFTESEVVAGFMAEQILTYIFGGTIECSVIAGSGTFEHKANWFLGTDYWEDIVGGVLVDGGQIEHTNDSLWGWHEWQDVVGEAPEGSLRSTYVVTLENPFLFFNSVAESNWFADDDSEDCRLYIRSWAAPGNSVTVNWKIYRQQLLPEGTGRAHYEVEITTGTPLTNINYVSWLTDDPKDIRLQVLSEAESPFRWFRAEWRVYSQEARERQIIVELLTEPLS